MNRKEVQRCGSCRERLPESLIKSRHAHRSRYTGALLCDRCGTSPSPYSSMELFPERARVPKSKEILAHEIRQMVARLTTAPDPTAIHEAGHAVVAHRLGMVIDSVRMDSPGGHGHTIIQGGRLRPSIERAAALFAGPLAESRWCPDSPGGEENDERALHDLLSADLFDVRAAADLAETLLDRHAADVDRVAQELSAHGELTGAEIAALLDGSNRYDPIGKVWRPAGEEGRVYGPEPNGIPVPGRAYEYRWWLPSSPFSAGCEYRSDRIPAGQWRQT